MVTLRVVKTFRRLEPTSDHRVSRRVARTGQHWKARKERCILSLKIKRFRLNSYEPSAMPHMEGLISGNVSPRPLISRKEVELV